jgi:hypothetical protein
MSKDKKKKKIVLFILGRKNHINNMIFSYNKNII